MSELIKKEAAVVDGFEGYEDGVEGHDRSANTGLIQGLLAKFTNEATWPTSDGGEISPDLELIAVGVTRAVQFWQDGKPDANKTRILEPGEKFPDVEAMNEAVPRSEWEEGPDGKPRGPWRPTTFVYLLDPATMQKYTFPTGTTGGAIAIRELTDKVKWIRRIKGDNIYAVVTLGDTFMKTRFGGRQRPHFKIVKWTKLGGEGGDVQALPKPPATPAPAAVPLAPVSEPTIEEDFDDELPGDLAPPKPVKPSKSAPKNGKRKVNALEAG